MPRRGVGERCSVGHLACEDLKLEDEAEFREHGDVPLHHWVRAEIGAGREAVLRVLVPVELLSDSAQQRVRRQGGDLTACTLAGQVGVADDRLRPAGAASLGGHPGDLVGGLARRPVRLNVDGCLDALASDVEPVLLNRIVAADRLVGSEDARLHRAREPGQIVTPPDVEMGVDRHQPHRPREKPRISSAIAPGLPPFPSRSSSGRIARNAPVSGR
jgi:hypothetical protein